MSFSLSPNLACVLTVAGILLLYCELLWPGKLGPGILGSLAAMWGIYWLTQAKPTTLGVGLLSAGAICMALESRYKTSYVMGAMATVLLGAGFWKLYSQQPRIAAGVAFPVSGAFGLVTVWLLATASARETINVRIFEDNAPRFFGSSDFRLNRSRIFQ